MSPINLSNKICEMGEVNYEKSATAFTEQNESTIIANDILSEILENAMDIAINTVNKNSADSNGGLIEGIENDYIEKCPEIKDIIAGLSKINIDRANPELAPHFEMKHEIMAPSYETMFYENLPRKDGVGDQSVECNQPELETATLRSQISKPVEKKSRVTDLVMNSKKVLNNLLDEEERKRLEEWEENNEHVLQVIELESKKASPKPRHDICPENMPLPYDEDEGDLLQKVDEATMDTIDLNNKGGEKNENKGGEGDDINKANPANLDDKQEKSEGGVAKKKRWNFNFKFFSLKKKSKSLTENEN